MPNSLEAVQAAIGGLALVNASNLPKDHPNFEEFNKHGLVILTLAVLAILVTAPIGSAAIMITYPYLLEKDSTSKKSEEEEPALEEA